MNTTESKFLIVDDYPALCRLTVIMLENLGYPASRTAASGEEALRMLRAERYDFVITDINMPNMNGFELLRAIKGDDHLKHLPVLMVTADARKEDIVLAAQSGAAGYIVKPFTKGALEEKILKILQKLAAAA